MALTPVGAVGIRVRPDATGFRSETKRDVMSQLKGLEGEVKVSPHVVASRSEIQAGINRATRGIDSTVKVDVEVDAKKAEAELKRFERALDSNKKMRIEIDAKIDKAAKALEDARENARKLNDEYESLNNKSFTKLSSAQRKLANSQRQLLVNTEKLAKAEEAVEKARSRADGSTDSRRLAAVEKATAALEKQRITVRELELERSKAEQAVTKAQRSQLTMEETFGKRVRDANAELVSRERLFARQVNYYGKQIEDASNLERIERNLHTLRTASHDELISFLREQGKGMDLWDSSGNLVKHEREVDAIAEAYSRLRKEMSNLDTSDLKTLDDFIANGSKRSAVAHLRVEADTALAEAELNRLEHQSRTVRIGVRIDNALESMLRRLNSPSIASGARLFESSWGKALKGFGASVSGISSMQRMTDLLKASAGNMENLAVRAGILSTALGAIGGAATHAIGGITSMGVGLASIARGAVMLPSALGAVGVMFLALKRNGETFVNALRGSTEAMDELASHSQSTADEVGKIVEMFSEASRSGSDQFFKNAEAGAIGLADAVKPLASLWESANASAGKFFGGILQSVKEWNTHGNMEVSVERIGNALSRVTGVGKNFSDMLFDMVDVGATRLPGLAQAFSDMTDRWAKFIDTSAKNGDMGRWIDEAGSQLKGLGSAIDGAVGALAALGRAADEAGYTGFVSLGKNMQAVERQMSSPLWQTGMTNIFKGAREGAAESARGFKVLGDSVMEVSGQIREAESLVGRTIGNFASGIGQMLTHSRFMSGYVEMLNDIAGASENAGNMMMHLGDVMGDGARVAGELFKAAMQVADAFLQAWADSAQFNKGLEDIIPVIADFVTFLIQGSHAIAGPFLDGLGQLLSGFSRLPGPVQTAVLGLGLFLGVMSKLRGIGGIPALGEMAGKLPIVGGAASKAVGGLRDFGQAWSDMGRLIGQVGLDEATNQLRRQSSELTAVQRAAGQVRGSFSQIAGGFREIRSSSSGVASGVSEISRGLGGLARTGAVGAVNGIKSAMGGLLGALGGPWGLALMGISAGVMAIGQSSANAKANVDNIRSSLDGLGNVTQETSRVISDGFAKMDTGFGNFMRSGLVWEDGAVKMRDFGDAVELSGTNMQQLGQDVASSGGEWSNYRQHLEDAGNIMRESGRLTEEQATALFGTADAAKLTGNDIDALKDAWDKQNNALKQAKQEQEAYAQATGLTSAKSQEFKSAIDTINDGMASSSDKAQAASSAIDILNGSMREGDGAASGYYGSLDSLGDAFTKAAEAVGAGEHVFGEWTDATGHLRNGIDLTSEAGRELSSTLGSSWDEALKYAQQAKDSAGDQAQGIADSEAVLADWRENVRQQLSNMGITGQQAEDIINQVAGKDYEANIALMGGAEVYKEVQGIAKKANEEIDGKTFEAFLKANPDMANKSADEVYKKFKEWDGKTATARAKIEALGEDRLNELRQAIEGFDNLDPDVQVKISETDPGKLEHIKQSIDDFTGLKPEVQLKVLEASDSKLDAIKRDIDNFGGLNPQVQVKILEAPDSKLDAIKKNIDNFSSLTPEVQMKVLEAPDSRLEDIKNRVDDFDKLSPEAQAKVLEAPDSQLDEVIDEVNDFDGKSVTADVDANDNASQKIKEAAEAGASYDTSVYEGEINAGGNAGIELDGIIQKARDWVGGMWSNQVAATTVGKMEVDDLLQKAATWAGGLWANVVTASTVGGDVVGTLVQDAKDWAMGMFANTVTATVIGADLVGTLIQSAKDWAVGQFSNIVTATVQGGDTVGTLLQNAKTFVGGMWSGTVTAVTFGATEVGDLKDKISGMVGKTVRAGAEAFGQGPVEGVRGAVGSLFDKTVKGGAHAFGEGPVSGVTGAIRSLYDRTVKAGATPFGQGGVEGVIGAIRGLFDKNTRDGATPFGQRGVEAVKGAIDNLYNKTVRAAANVFGTGAVQGLRGAIDSLYDKTVTVTHKVINWVVDKFTKERANGGIDRGGAAYFANGGVRKHNAIQSFAYGGIRNLGSGRHNAQIKYPQGPNVTVWAEGAGTGNTAGEAFIPLAATKRTRSTRILGQVAGEFGLGVVKYENGGMTSVGGVSAPAVSGTPGIDYRRMARAFAAAQPGYMDVRVTNTHEMSSTRRR